MKEVNVGVIGVGAMGLNHARVYSRIENANLLAVSDLMKDKADEVAAKYNATSYKDYKDVLEITEIDAVSVCVPTTHHHQVVMDAIEHDKHVLVEKPIAFTLKEAREMVKAAKKNDLKLATGHVERFNPVVQEAKALIQDGAIGNVVSTSAKRVGPFPPRIKDVGVTVDLAIHDLDVMYYLLDDPIKEVFANMGSILEKCEYEDHAEIMTKFASGIIGMLEVNWLTPYKKRELEITGVEGIISLDYIDQTVDVYGKFTQKIGVEQKEPLKEELSSFLHSIINDETPAITGEDGIYALKGVLAAMESARRELPVKINDY
ncbi:MAG: Gfo/Idh/MocA family oxidoreductase [Methanobacteriaceae archaeon]|nr:Gfo/Idh/MocA family oxidoreductase [Methanobacteriaceae archaeon]